MRGLFAIGALLLVGCSPATERQIRSALRAGFHGIRLDPAELGWSAAEAEAVTSETIIERIFAGLPVP